MARPKKSTKKTKLPKSSRGPGRPKSTPKEPLSTSEKDFKPSDLKKDRQDTLRTNTMVKEALLKKGMSLQELLDEAIDNKLKLDIKLGVG